MRKIMGSAAAFVTVLTLGFVSGIGGASAAVDNSVTTAVTGGFTDVTSLLTGTLIPALMALVVIGIAVLVALKYLRRGSSKA